MHFYDSESGSSFTLESMIKTFGEPSLELPHSCSNEHEGDVYPPQGCYA